MTYRVQKLDLKSDKIIDYGKYSSMQDVNLIIRGYAFDMAVGRDDIYTRKNSRYFYVVSNLEG